MNNIRRTGDGSYTLFDVTSGECFHSHKGALAESEHVFLNASELQQRLQIAQANGGSVRIIEMGLGTGLNYLLSARAAQAAGVPLEYHALETNLLGTSVLASLNYRNIPGLDELSAEYIALMEGQQALPDGIHHYNTCTGSLYLHVGDALHSDLPSEYFTLCFFDAFSPNSAPALWQQPQLQKFYNALQHGGTWVSYCVRGSVRRDLIRCGFAVEKLPGPPGKREMLRATRP